MVRLVNHPRQAISKTTDRIAAFREGRHPYDGVRMPTATERRKEARKEESAITLRKRATTIANAADDLLDLKRVDLVAALADPEEWAATSEALAKAAEAIAQMQAAVAGMVPK